MAPAFALLQIILLCNMLILSNTFKLKPSHAIKSQLNSRLLKSNTGKLYQMPNLIIIEDQLSIAVINVRLPGI